ncbi:MAG: hypothetical protein WDM77_21325 [Steroidobacteraceae bacterium]
MKIIVALGAVLSALASVTASAQGCSRDCLKQHLDTYLTAITSHKPGAGELWAGFRQTENAVVIPEGEGTWKSVTGLGSVQNQYLDPVQSQAGYFGTVFMGKEEAVVAVRVKVQQNQVTEAEWFIARKSDPGVTGEPGKTPFSIETLRATLPAQRVVSKSERMQREAMQSVVNSYFDGITSHNGLIVKGHPGCSRYENGFPTFDRPMKPGMNDIGNNGKTDCRTQGDFGVAIVALRTFYVIDEESQTVMVEAVFRRDARNPKRRNHFTELFHLDHGKIRTIHACFYYAPDDRPVPNWPPYDGLFPLPGNYN